MVELMSELLLAGFIDPDQNIAPEKADEFFAAYPEFTTNRLKPDKIVEHKDRARVKIRQDRYHEIKPLRGGR